jgi:ribosomal protein S18 acetylase RimI-like enzyme
MNAPVIRPYEARDEEQVIDLWRRCDLVMPWNEPHADIATKLTQQADLFLVAVLDGRVVGSAMAGFDGHRGWVNYVAVAPELQGSGVGRALMAAVETALRARGCPKLNLQVRRWNTQAVGFYERLGYTVEDMISMGKRLDRE